MRITEKFRRAMGALHTWAGLLLGAVLFAIFWMGTLSVFDKEIDRWMIPELRLPAAPAEISYDAMLKPAFAAIGEDASLLNFIKPNERVPTLRIYYNASDGSFPLMHLDPHTGAGLDATDSLAGSRFIFPFHYSFHLGWKNLGYWIVGFAGMSMLVLLVSGILIHRKIIADFFTFRPRKKARRSTLDLHNMTGLIALPFHFLIAFSGVLIFYSIYFPSALQASFGGDGDRMAQELFGAYSVPASGEPGQLASIDDMVAHAERAWSERAGAQIRADVVRVFNYGDAAATVYIRNTFPERRVLLSEHIMVLDGATGAVLSDYAAPPVKRAFAWLSGLHFIQFDHWPLRWLYFLGGLAGCVMIATGNLFWMRARIARNGAEPVKVRVIRGLTVGATTGIVMATGAFLAANRLLEKEAAFAGYGRAELEVWAFFLVWIGAFAHAALRNKNAWREQVCAIAAFAVCAVMLNWVTTGDHLARSLTTPHLWPIAGMDLVLFASAGLAVWSAMRLRKSEAAAAGRPARIGALKAPAE